MFEEDENRGEGGDRGELWRVVVVAVEGGGGVAGYDAGAEEN